MRIASFGLLVALGVIAGGAAQAGPACGTGGDSDCDFTIDSQDFCVVDPLAPNPCGLDTDVDGYGNRCDGDFNQDGVVTSTDAATMLAALGSGTPTAVGEDMNCDGVVTSSDATLFLDQLAQGLPGPSGLPCAGSVPCP